MRKNVSTRNSIILTATALGATAAALGTLTHYVQHEINQRGYPSWESCHCDFKAKQTIFLIWHSRTQQRGATVVSQEWGIPLTDPPTWLRRFLHHSAQVLATLHPGGHYVERIALNPQEARQFAFMLHATSPNEEVEEEATQETAYVIWRREILQVPRRLLDAYTRRLYPVHIPQERGEQAQPLPTLWDSRSNLPLPSEGVLLETPTGTHIDYIGWSPSQISYCTARTTSTPFKRI